MSNNSLSFHPRVISEILEYPGPFYDEDEKAACRRMVEELTPEEQETAARVSYAYWYAAMTQDICPSDEVRIRSAMKEARRHFVGERGIYEHALKHLRHSCGYRQEHKLDLLRHCFSSIKVKDEADQEFVSRCEALIERELEAQPTVVRGHDKNGRAIHHRSSRVSGVADAEGYKIGIIYMAEKGFTCTEVMTKGREEKIIVILDYGAYASSMSPPLHVSEETIKLLQKNYPERAYKVIVLDPPFWMRCLYTVISVFLAPETREKITLTSESHKADVFGGLVDPEHATPFMLDEGQLTAKVDIHHALHNVPFHSLYIEK